MAEYLVRSPAYPRLLATKARQLAAPERHRPLATYREAELAVMSRNFFDPAEPYAELRRAFVFKEKPTHTPAPPGPPPDPVTTTERASRLAS